MSLDIFCEMKGRYLYTWGYGGRGEKAMDDLVKFLIEIRKKHGITSKSENKILIIDCRYYPRCKWNKNFDFNPYSKINYLESRLNSSWCEYLLTPHLFGNEEKKMNYEYFFLRLSDSKYYQQVKDVVKHRIIVLMCAEKNVFDNRKRPNCHRLFIAKFFNTFYKYEVVHR